MLPVAIYEGCHEDLTVAYTFTAICQKESGMKVRRWYPEVKPCLDAAGTHNSLLCLELYREKFITDNWRWRKSLQWPAWYKLFQERPDIGTLIAARAFYRIVEKCGLENAIEIWNMGHVGTPVGMKYAATVRQLRSVLSPSHPSFVLRDIK